MKIKLVCELTELSDRTIRYYIEEGLISPNYSENYLGRKSFDFSETDVQMLKNIAVLRTFGFSIANVKSIIETPEASQNIISEIYDNKYKAIHNEQAQLHALENLDKNRSYTLYELAEALNTQVASTQLPVEDTKWNLKCFVYSSMKAIIIWILALIPILFVLYGIIESIHTYQYPTVDFRSFIAIYFTLLPSLCIFLVSKVKMNEPVKRWKKNLFLILCVLYIPISFVSSLLILGHSETTDILNYRKLDSDCFANRDHFYQELFPIWPHYFIHEKQPDGSYKDVYIDAHYYYQFILGFDYTYDIYAEWPLEKEEFNKEVSRVKALFENDNRHGNYEYVTVNKGSFICMIKYDGNKPFEKVTNSYDYYIFAYDEENLVVRYISCNSLENGADQPYYLKLDW